MPPYIDQNRRSRKKCLSEGLVSQFIGCSVSQQTIVSVIWRSTAVLISETKGLGYCLDFEDGMNSLNIEPATCRSEGLASPLRACRQTARLNQQA